MLPLPRGRMLTLLLTRQLIVLATPLVTGLIIRYLLDGDQTRFASWTIVLLVLPFLEAAASGRWEWYQGYLVERSGTRLRARLFDHLLALPLRWFAERPTGELLARSGADIQFLASYERDRFAATQAALTLAVAGGVLVWQHPLLLIVLLAAAIPQCVQYVVRARTSNPDASEEVVRAADRADEYLRERLDIMPMTRFCGAADWEERQCERVIVQQGLPAELARLRADHRLAMGGVAGLAMSSLMLFTGGGWLLDAGKIDVGSFVMAYGYSARVWSSLVDWVAWYRRTGEARTRGTLAERILAVQPETRSGEPAPEAVDTLELRQVSFGYPGRPSVLARLDLKVCRGEVVALAGPSGCGKSTVLDLLAGLIRPSRGRILVNGSLDLDTVNERDWRAHITYAPQLTSFRSAGLSDNLRYGLARSGRDSEGRMLGLLERVGLTELGRRLRDGGEAGFTRTTSGGQRQRLGVVRACLNDRSVLALFDEPSSAIDSVTEELVLNLITEQRENGPVVFTAHRQSTMLYADRVIVLDRGTIVDQGTPIDILTRHQGFNSSR